jgi:pantoate--beta-alanine ligase
MKIINTVNEWNSEKTILRGRTAGLVPTMGALHEGHLSLAEKSLAENDVTVVSIYLNPTQFNNKSDLAAYPRSFEDDCALLEKAGADYVFAPDYIEMYPDNYRFRIGETEKSLILCGEKRPGHFEGVLTVVMKLLNIIRPARAYFGEKDYQQFVLVKEMAEAFFLPTEIIPCPIVREINGLAMSSRNRLLSAEGKEKAAALHQAISSGKIIDEMRTVLGKKGFTVDYLEERSGRIFAAAFLEDVRLIDNVKR